MVKFKKTIFFFTLLITVAILQACNQEPSPEEEIYSTLEKVVELEDMFKNQQKPIVKLEEKEKILYDKIISLGMKQFDEISKLSSEALTIVDEREEKINKEQESIQASQEHFKTVLSSINEMEDESLKIEAENLFGIMENRYSAYDELYNHYILAIHYDKELYIMFQQRDLTLDELENQIEEINHTYEKVMKANDIFNQYTDKYNKAKLALYKHLGMDVEYTEKDS